MSAPAGRGYYTDREIAELLGRTLGWFRANRARLEAAGFPRRDALLCRTHAGDVQTWIARRAVLAPATLPPRAGTGPAPESGERLDAL